MVTEKHKKHELDEADIFAYDGHMQLSKKRITSFQKEILAWYEVNKRDLPWRKDRDPYHILVSEVMLQQTQVPRVINKYQEWMQAFPMIQDLAKASTREVFEHWSGLGYNRRALYLHNFAKKVVAEFAGQIPADEKTLLMLPGIGEYTARALLCFAFDMQLAVIDTNIKKVIAVKFFKGIVPEKKVLVAIADQLVPVGKAYDWNQALMDYAGAMLKEHKIPIPKQSTFKDSDRYYRGRIVKLATESTRIPFSQLEKELQIPRERIERIVIKLQKDGFILFEKNEIRCVS